MSVAGSIAAAAAGWEGAGASRAGLPPVPGFIRWPLGRRGIYIRGMAVAVSLSARWEVRLRVSRSRPSVGWVLLLSLGVHLAVLLLLLFAPRPKPPPEPMLPSTVAMMFLPPKPGARSAPNPGPQAMPAAPPPAAAAPRAAPALPPPPPAPPPQPAALPQPAPPPPAEQARVEPPAPAPAPEVAPSSASVVPPPPRAIERRMVASSVPLRPAPERRRPPPAFPEPTAFSLGRPLTSAPSASRSLPASYGPAAKGPLSFGQFARVTAGHMDPSWLNELHDWWNRHAYYPDQAVANGEDGTVGIQIVVDRYGHVRSVERESRSGSVWLDMAALGTFRNANLPPLPPDTPDQTITVDLAITYILVRQQSMPPP